MERSRSCTRPPLDFNRRSAWVFEYSRRFRKTSQPARHSGILPAEGPSPLRGAKSVAVSNLGAMRSFGSAYPVPVQNSRGSRSSSLLWTQSFELPREDVNGRSCSRRQPSGSRLRKPVKVLLQSCTAESLSRTVDPNRPQAESLSYRILPSRRSSSSAATPPASTGTTLPIRAKPRSSV